MSLIFSTTDVADHIDFVRLEAEKSGPGRSERPRIDADVTSTRAERTHLLLKRAIGSDPIVAHRLHDEAVLLNIEVAESIVMRYRNRGVPVEDLVQVACLGLVKAVRGFDPDKSDNFLAYAVPTILGEVKRFFRDNAWVIKPPRRIQELQADISSAAATLMHSSGRVPTPAELSSFLDASEADVVEAMSADSCFAPRSLDRTQGDPAEATCLADSLGEEDQGYSQAEAIVALSPLCRELSERDRRLIYLRFFLEWTQARIAEDFGVTQMQVSRLLTRVLASMRESLTAEPRRGCAGLLSQATVVSQRAAGPRFAA